MRTISCLLLIVSLSVGCATKETATPATGAAPVAPPSIEGEYVIIGGEFMGKAQTAEELAKDTKDDLSFKITKDTIEVKSGGKAEQLKYTIDPSKSPGEIDIVMPQKGKKDEISYGIYKLEGDQLTFFVMGAREAKNRPKEFKTQKFDKAKPDQDLGFFIVAKKK